MRRNHGHRKEICGCSRAGGREKVDCDVKRHRVSLEDNENVPKFVMVMDTQLCIN